MSLGLGTGDQRSPPHRSPHNRCCRPRLPSAPWLPLRTATCRPQDLGIQQVKNIQEPIRAYQVGAPSETREVAPVRATEAESPPPLPDKPSIAVLPFENMSG